jgi:hypothetical protein
MKLEVRILLLLFDANVEALGCGLHRVVDEGSVVMVAVVVDGDAQTEGSAGCIFSASHRLLYIISI